MNGYDNFLINLHNPQLFRRIVSRLLAHKYGSDYVNPDDDQADSGNDGYIISVKRQHAVHCFKKEHYSDAKVLVKARSDLKKAVNLKTNGKEMNEWSFITAYRLPDRILSTLEGEVAAAGLTFVPLGPDNLAALIGEFADQMQDIPEIALAVKVRDSTLSPPESESLNKQQLDLGNIKEIPVAEDDAQFENLTEIMRMGKAAVKENEQLFLTTYYTGKTLHSRLQAGLGLLHINKFSESNVSDVITLIDSLISTATLLGDTSTLANLHAERGSYISHQFVMLDFQTSSAIEMQGLFGLNAYSKEELEAINSRLRDLQAEYFRSFSEALNMAFETNDWKALAHVALKAGSSAGGRYTHFNGFNITQRAEQEKIACKKLLDISINAFIVLNDREGQLIAQHNLANQLRFMGEVEQARQIIQVVVQEAEENHLNEVLPTARMLKERLESDDPLGKDGPMDTTPVS